MPHSSPKHRRRAILLSKASTQCYWGAEVNVPRNLRHHWFIIVTAVSWKSGLENPLNHTTIKIHRHETRMCLKHKDRFVICETYYRLQNSTEFNQNG